MALKEHVFLITGATGGIGSGTALQLAQQGAALMLSGRNAEILRNIHLKCQDTLNSLGLPDRVLSLPGDVTNKEDIERIVKTAVAYFSKIDTVASVVLNYGDDVIPLLTFLMIHAAGATKLRPVTSCTIEDLDWTYDVTVRSTFMLLKAAMPYLEKTKGHFLNIGAIAGMRPFSFSIPFTVASCGADRLVAAASVGLNGRFRINSVNLGATLTGFFDNAMIATHGRMPTQAEVEMHDKNCALSIPIGRLATADDVIKVIVFMCSEGATFLNGVTWPVDGSFTNTSYIPGQHGGNKLTYIK